MHSIIDNHSQSKTFAGFLSRHRVLLIVFTIHIILWGIIDQFINPHPDYIDHWMQSRVFSLSYFEHPPMVALLIRAVTALFGHTEAGLEAAALFVDLLIIGFAYSIAVFLYGRRAGIFTLVGMEATPFFMAKSASIQTEQPLALFWLAALLSLLIYQKTDKARWILLMGFFAGCGALSKYTMIIFYIGILTYFTLVPSRRKELLNPWQYLGGLVALAVFFPVIYWNYTHDWISFRFQLAKGGAAEDVIYGYEAGLFLLGTFMLYSFVLVGWGFWRIVQRIRQGDISDANRKLVDSPNTLLVALTVTPILFFVVVLFRSDYSDPQWAVIAMVTFFIWLGGESSRLWQEGRKKMLLKVYVSAFAANICLMIIVFVHIYQPLVDFPKERKDPVYPLIGWDKMGKEVELFLKNRDIPLPDYVIANRYALASQFALHLPSYPRTYSTSRVRRNLWSDPREMNSENTILVCETNRDCRKLENRVGKTTSFIAGREGEVSIQIRGRVRTIGIYRIVGKDPRLLSETFMDPRLQLPEE